MASESEYYKAELAKAEKKIKEEYRRSERLGRCLDIGQGCLDRWHRRVRAARGAESGYSIYLWPHSSKGATCYDIGRGAVEFKDSEGRWSFKTYVESGYNDSKETEIARGKYLQDILPTEEDGKLLYFLGVRIRIEHSGVRNSVRALAEIPGVDTGGLLEKLGRCFRSHPYWPGGRDWFVSERDLENNMKFDLENNERVAVWMIPEQITELEEVTKSLEAFAGAASTMMDVIDGHRHELREGCPAKQGGGDKRDKHKRKREK